MAAKKAKPIINKETKLSKQKILYSFHYWFKIIYDGQWLSFLESSVYYRMLHMIDYSRQREREWDSDAPGFEVNSVMAIVSWFTFEAINTPLAVYQERILWDLHLRLLLEWQASVGLVSNCAMKYMFTTAFI
jgi:hypothetical protein